MREHASGDRSITLTDPSISRSDQPEIVRSCQEVWRLMDSIGWPTSLPGYPQLYGYLRLIGFNYRSAKITLAIQRNSQFEMFTLPRAIPISSSPRESVRVRVNYSSLWRSNWLQNSILKSLPSLLYQTLSLKVLILAYWRTLPSPFISLTIC